ncbi:MAG: hypothetical protein ABI406_18375 [Ktedonobacteraceae bacterium]
MPVGTDVSRPRPYPDNNIDDGRDGNGGRDTSVPTDQQKGDISYGKPESSS